MLIGRATRFNPPSIPIERLASRLQRSPRRRIDDAVREVFFSSPVWLVNSIPLRNLSVYWKICANAAGT